jgi:predicted PurR-regulated permease PerM
MAYPLSRPVVISYLFVILTLILTAALHLGTPFITVLFSYFALRRLNFRNQKWVAAVLFVILVGIIFSAFVLFMRQALVELPDLVATAIPVVVRFAERHGIDLPFTDMHSLKDTALETVRDTLGYLGRFAKIATKEFFLLIMGLVIAVALFLNPKHKNREGVKTLYSLYESLITERFTSFYKSFETVMGAQLLISLINTALSAAFVLGCSLHYPGVVIGLTFLCGLVPIVGNVIGNIVIVGVAFTVSPQLAGWALVFLISIHKLEYFLNSKIVGGRIWHPMWLTLIGLILGERLMGIPGLILAPVILNFIKIEASKFPVADGPALENT